MRQSLGRRIMPVIDDSGLAEICDPEILVRSAEVLGLIGSLKSPCHAMRRRLFWNLFIRTVTVMRKVREDRKGSFNFQFPMFSGSVYTTARTRWSLTELAGTGATGPPVESTMVHFAREG